MIEEAAMDTVPNGNVEQKFQEMLAKLTATPALPATYGGGATFLAAAAAFT